MLLLLAYLLSIRIHFSIMSVRGSFPLILCMVDELNNNGPATKVPAIRHRARTLWVHETIHRKQKYSEYHHLVQELLLDEAWFQAYFRLIKREFELLPQKVGGTISRAHTMFRVTVSRSARVSVPSTYGDLTSWSAMLKQHWPLINREPTPPAG